jgi:class 3 adenylate cyclase
MDMLKIPRKRESPPPDLAAAAQVGNAPTMEVAHVLFMDVVGFSQLRMNQQAMVQVELQNLVQATQEVQQARKEGKLIVRPTGDGMALLFLRDLLSPIRCALQLHTLMQNRDAEIRGRIGSPIRLRMGIHSGSVLMVEDMNAQSDVAGDGIIMAQRVMDCGDTGHILLSDEVARKILGTDPWPRYLTDLGECRVKHGVKVHLYNLYGRLDGPYCGNPSTPKKVETDRGARAQEEKAIRGTFFERNPGAKKWITTFVVLGTIGGGGYALWTKVPAVPKFVNASWAKAVAMTKPKPTPTPKPNKNTKSVKSNSGGKQGGSGGGSGSGGGGYAGNDKAMATVPDVLGQTYDGAKSALRDEGFRIGSRGKSFNSEYGVNTVCKQSPAPGANVRYGSTIYVVISKGEPVFVPYADPTPVPDPDPTPEPTSGGGESGGTETNGSDNGGESNTDAATDSNNESSL